MDHGRLLDRFEQEGAVKNKRTREGLGEDQAPPVDGLVLFDGLEMSADELLDKACQAILDHVERLDLHK